ncbi:hypothetical protein RV00_GL002808 [Enterococcus devriesei]|uniref:LPXTG-domain-containing protein cell wall anchor domain n=2 Tax=Enterococcus devriesei TaxID=319970 RepID=A0A1L8STT2_9ENTE|nr:hypothetical protein RV00_GL002808 [Enterococcus devriesei]
MKMKNQGKKSVLFVIIILNFILNVFIVGILPAFAQTSQEQKENKLFESNFVDMIAEQKENHVQLKLVKKGELATASFASITTKITFDQAVLTLENLHQMEKSRPMDELKLMSQSNGRQEFDWSVKRENLTEDVTLVLPMIQLAEAKVKVLSDETVLFDSEASNDQTKYSTPIEKNHETSTIGTTESNVFKAGSESLGTETSVSRSSDNSQEQNMESQNKQTISKTTNSQNDSTFKSTKESQPVKKSKEVSAIPDKLDGTHFDDLFSYNVYVSGDHSANQADTEGGIAVKGNSAIVANSTAGFNYGGYFDNSSSGLGHTLGPEQNVSLLLGGRIYAQNISKNSIAKVGNGYSIVSNAKQGTDGVPSLTPSDWPNVVWPGPNTYKASGKVELSDNELKGIFTKLDDQLADYTKQLTALTEQTDVYLNGSQDLSVKGMNIQPYPRYEYRVSKMNERVLVVDVPPINDDIAILPQVQMDYFNITNPDLKIDQVIITTSAKKVAIVDEATGTALSYKDNISHGNAIAKRITFFAPKATQISTFRPDGESWNSVRIPDFDKELGTEEASKGVENYNSTTDVYGPQFLTPGRLSTHPMVWGSIVAPQATVLVSGGSINGYVFAKNLHQRGGAEIHNFINPFITKEAPGLFDIVLYKHAKDDVDTPLSGAKFILQRKEGNVTTYYTGNKEQQWVSDADLAKEFTTDTNGKINIKDLTKETGTDPHYFFEETKAPSGYKKLTSQIEAKPTEKGNYLYADAPNELAEVPKYSKLILRKGDITGKPLEGATFILTDKDLQKNPDHNVLESSMSKIQKLNFPELSATNQASVVFDYDLKPGTYYVYESEFPEQYGPGKDTPSPTHPLKIIISVDGKAQIITDYGEGPKSLRHQTIVSSDGKETALLLSDPILNYPNFYNLQINKTDENDKPIKDIVFKVTATNKNIEKSTDAQGIADFSELAMDKKYKIEEVKTVSGYGLWRGYINMVVKNHKIAPELRDQDGNLISSNSYTWDIDTRTLSLKIRNHKIPKLPMTGGSGNRLLWISVIILMTGFIGYKVDEKRRSK